MTALSQTLNPSQCAAMTDFRRANTRGRFRNIIATITGRTNQLLDLETISKGEKIRCRSYIGTHTVAIDQIKGSEGRCQDFDQDFNPLKSHSRDRWVRIALAWLCGVCLPAVDLIKVKDIYIVRDGHHRISVARFMGCEYTDAHVTEWVVDA
jgi:hypothetical protein